MHVQFVVVVSGTITCSKFTLDFTQVRRISNVRYVVQCSQNVVLLYHTLALIRETNHSLALTVIGGLLKIQPSRDIYAFIQRYRIF